MAARKQTAIVGLKVRLREPLRKKLEVAAKQKGVSLNSELTARLETSFTSEAVEQVIDAKFAELLERMQSGPPGHWSEEAKAFDNSLEPARRKQREEMEEREKRWQQRLNDKAQQHEKEMQAKYEDKS